MPNRTTQLEFFILEPQSGRLLPKFDLCSLTGTQGIRAYKEALGATLAVAGTALDDAEGPLTAAIEAMNDSLGTVDRLLAQNPDPTTPSSTGALMDSIGGLTPTTDRETLERRAADILDLNVVNGVLFPKGTVDLGPMRALFRSLEVAGTGCRIPSLDEEFLMVTAVQDTSEAVVRGPCGDDISAFTVTERRVGTNITIAKAAELEGVDESQVLIRFYWINEVKIDGPTLRRLKALGLQGDDLTAVVLLQETARVRSFLIDATVLTTLQTGELTDDEICTMMNRPDNRGGVNVAPTADEVVGAIRSAINANTGANRNRAGLGDDAIIADDQGVAPSGRAGDPGLLLAAILDLGRSLRLGIVPRGPVVGGFAQSPVIVDGEVVGGVAQGPITVDGVVVGGFTPVAGPPGQMTVDGEIVPFPDEPQECLDLTAFIFESVAAVLALAQRAAAFLQQIYGQLGLGVHTLQTGVQYTTCLASINLGLDISLDLAAALPFSIESFLALMSTQVAAFFTAVTAIKGVLCIPQALIDLLFGGVCGFKPFDFTLCLPDIQELIERLQTLVLLATSLVTQAGASLQNMKVDLQAGLRGALDLKTFSTCAAAVFPAGIVLGLAGADLTGQLSTSVATTVTTQEGIEELVEGLG